jgi:hypothetical protein
MRDEQCAMVPRVEEPVEAGKCAARNVSGGGAMQHQISCSRIILASLQSSGLKAALCSP